MPADTVILDLSTATGAVSQETYNDAIIFARAMPEDEPPVGFNQPQEYRDSSNVAQDFGEGSGAHIASQQMEAAGTRQWEVVCLEETEHTEVIGDSSSSAVSQGSVSNTPVAGSFDVQVSLDGESQNVEAVTATPVDSDGSPSSGEAYFHYDTGEVVTGDESSGTGTGIEVTYHSLSWQDTFRNIQGSETDLCLLADVHIGKSNIGDADELATWGAGNYTFFVGAVQDGSEYATDDEYRQAAQEISSYLTSSDIALWAHKSPDDVAAAITGWLATHRPWHDPTNAEIGVTSDPIRRAEIGNPETQGTFEGGTAEDGAGPLNVLMRRQGVLVSSNDLTTAGSGSNYRYLDVRRTEGFVASEAEDALIGLALANSDKGIPFNTAGQTMISNVLTNRLSRYDYARGPYTDLNVVVPPAEELSQDQRANRIWGEIEVEYRINGNVHRFRVQINARA